MFQFFTVLDKLLIRNISLKLHAGWHWTLGLVQLYKCVQSVRSINCIILSVALICDKIDGLTNRGQSLDKLIKHELLETNTSLFHILKSCQIRLKVIHVLVAKQLIHHVDLFSILLGCKLSLILDKDALLAHLLH